MSLIRNEAEKQVIKNVAIDLANIKGNKMQCSEILAQKQEESAFCKRNNEIKPIIDYYYETPVELQLLLNRNWDLLQEESMKKFVSVSTISAFKNKMVDLKQGVVSPYIYEF